MVSSLATNLCVCGEIYERRERMLFLFRWLWKGRPDVFIESFLAPETLSGSDSNGIGSSNTNRRFVFRYYTLRVRTYKYSYQAFGSRWSRCSVYSGAITTTEKPAGDPHCRQKNGNENQERKRRRGDVRLLCPWKEEIRHKKWLWCCFEYLPYIFYVQPTKCEPRNRCVMGHSWNGRPSCFLHSTPFSLY
jgi:hypothetical protein